MDAYREAGSQGGFTFINHPNWGSQRKDGIARIEPEQLELIEQDLIQGIEVVNDLTYSDEALELALAYDLAIIGTSDIHGLVDWQYQIAQGGHRPITVVLAKDRSVEAIQEALVARRTVAFYLDSIIGREEHVRPLLDASSRSPHLDTAEILPLHGYRFRITLMHGLPSSTHRLYASTTAQT